MNFLSLEMLAQGGPIVLVQLVVSVVALAIVLERLVYLRHSNIVKLDLYHEVLRLVAGGQPKVALETAKGDPSPMMRICEAALSHPEQTQDQLRETIEDAGRHEAPRLERYLTSLQTIAVISPLLGLLGTVTGMMRVFETIVTEGNGNTSLLAGGISEAMVTTAVGLTIAIPALVFYSYLSRRAENLLIEMERYALRLHATLGRRSK
ncbi:MAG: hypothetical protein A2426_04140 [Candidatus Lambdaproteobacteria bacterium RIFOXYC1_FULL_56_13]|nr:MAG: hypothetical protein A2426_04140 [Candidatus Lambdaproteobacteria bacterium RIFOXYC1_FULL_56_13]